MRLTQLRKVGWVRVRDVLRSAGALATQKTKSIAAVSREAHSSHGTTIEIKLALPQLPKLPTTIHPLINRLRRLDKRTLLIGGCGLVALSAIVTFGALQSGKPSSDANATIGSPLDRLERGTPDYPTVLPAGATAEELGGWTRISPPDRNPVFAYTDEIDGVPVSISQQPLPDEFKQNITAKVESMAYEFRANEKLTVKQSTLYIGSSAGGPQSVIMEKNGLLILMKSTAPIESKKWGDYAASLR